MREKALVFVAGFFTDLLGRTLLIEERGSPVFRPRAKPQKAVLWVLWHETILMSLWYHRFLNIRVLISESRDGERIARLAERFGYVPLRGSSSRGGARGARAILQTLRTGESCAVTPDGPRGPRRKVKKSLAWLARFSGAPVVPFGFAAKKAFRLSSWDRFLIPLPFTRAVFVYGEPLYWKTHGGTEETFCRNIQNALDALTEEAQRYKRG